MSTTLSPTDFPCPVAPAISKCGIRARSAIKVSLAMVLPITMGSSMGRFMNFSVENIVLRCTVSRFLLGTSMPMVPLPGMGAMMRMPRAARLRAMSSSRLLILEILMPASGTIS